MQVSKTFQGAYILSTIVGGRLFERQYMGYTLKEAKKLFSAAAKKEKASNDENKFSNYLKENA